MRIARASKRISCLAKPCQGRSHGNADVETGTGAAQVSCFCPSTIARHLVEWVEPMAFEQALRQAERHGRIIGPLSWLKTERSASDHVCERLEASSRAKLDGSADGVSNSEAQKAATKTICSVHLCTSRHTPAVEGPRTAHHRLEIADAVRLATSPLLRAACFDGKACRAPGLRQHACPDAAVLSERWPFPRRREEGAQAMAELMCRAYRASR